MNFLTKKEKSLLGLVKRSGKISDSEKAAVTNKIKLNARMRADGFRPKVKIAIHVIANHNSEKLLNKYVK